MRLRGRSSHRVRFQHSTHRGWIQRAASGVITQANPHVLENHVVALADTELLIRDRDAATWRRLSCNCNKRFFALEAVSQMNGAGDIEENGPRPGCSIHTPTKASRPRIV